MSAASLDCREYEAARKRNFQPYSRGHQIMYEGPLTLMERGDRAKEKFTILEAGFGIGWGLDRMIEKGVIGSYLGFEPDRGSFDYVRGRHKSTPNLDLRHAPFEGQAPQFDHVFCIEVIEHVPPDDHAGFITGLRKSLKSGGTLWLSTPDKERSTHGVRTASDWRLQIALAGFADITRHDEQWTTLYCCQSQVSERR